MVPAHVGTIGNANCECNVPNFCADITQEKAKALSELVQREMRWQMRYAQLPSEAEGEIMVRIHFSNFRLI